MSNERDCFEAWYTEEYQVTDDGKKHCFRLGADGTYRNMIMEERLKVWNAATAQQSQRIAQLESAISRFFKSNDDVNNYTGSSIFEEIRLSKSFDIAIQNIRNLMEQSK